MAGNATYSAPLAVISSTNQGGALLVVNIIGLIIAIVSVGVRIFLSKKSGENGFVVFKDDVLCYAATVLVIIESSIVWAGTHVGNGKSIDLLSPRALVKVEEYQYATDILYIIGLYLTRASVLFLLERLQKAPSNKVWRSGLALMTAEAIASVFMIALKCNLSHPWIQYNAQCTRLLARWYIIEISGVVMEALLLAAVVYLVYNVQMPRFQKVKVLLLFGTRILVILFGILRVTRLPMYLHSSNPTLTGIPAAIFAQAQLHVSLATCTTPLLKSFILEFNTLYGALNQQTVQSSRAYGPANSTNTNNMSHASGSSRSHNSAKPPTILASVDDNDARRTRADHWMSQNGAQNHASITHKPASNSSRSPARKGDGIEVSRSYNVASAAQPNDSISRVSSRLSSPRPE